MDCQDITHLLDDGDVGRMTDQERGAVEAHLFACPDCAADWKVHQRLVAGFAPPMPAGLTERARALVAAGVSTEARRVPRRAILFGTLLAVAAAAALLGLWLEQPGEVQAVVQSPQPLPAQSVVSPEAPAAVQPAAAAEPQPTAPPPRAHTVLIPPVKIEGNDAVGNELARRFRELVIAKLRVVPALTVVDPASGGAGRAEYEVRMSYSAASRPAVLDARILQADPVGSAVLNARMLKVDPATSAFFAAADAVIAAEAKMDYADQRRSQQAREIEDVRRLGASRPSGDLLMVFGLGFPASVMLDGPELPSLTDRVDYAATKVVRDLRVKFFPLDASLEAELLAVLRDPAQQENVRMSALGDLLSMAQRRGGLETTDAAVIRAGAELALIQRENGTQRTAVWNVLASTGNPAVVPYLIRALDTAQQAEARLQMVRILTDDFSNDPRAREALKVVSRPDVRQAVVMAQLRNSGDESKWSEFVVATLNDTSLPDLLRLQPIVEMTPARFSPFATAAGTPLSKLQLGDQAIRELGVLIIRASLDESSDDASRSAANRAVQALGYLQGPAVPDVLLEILKAPDNKRPEIRSESVNTIKTFARILLTQNFHADPRTRAAIEAVANDPAAPDSANAKLTLQSLDMKVDLERLRKQRELQTPQAPR